MIELPNRDNPIYKEIEEFEPYEFTNCIAYEMAIRNKEVKRIIKKLDIIKKLRLELYNKTYDRTRDKNKSIAMTRVYKEVVKKFPIIENAIVETILIEKLKKEFAINYNYFQAKDQNSKFKVSKYTPLFKMALMDEVFQPLGSRHKIRTNFKASECYLIEQLYNRKREMISEITPNFKKQLKLENTPTLKLELNFNLPKDELIAYISKIKDEYDNDNSIIKTPLELLGEDLEKSDNKHIQKKPKAEKYADWFYIYDCYQILKANDKKKSNETIYNEIDLSLLEHYDSNKEDYYSIETYKKTIVKNMNYLIDGKGYKELISGVKNN